MYKIKSKNRTDKKIEIDERLERKNSSSSVFPDK